MWLAACDDDSVECFYHAEDGSEEADHWCDVADYVCPFDFAEDFVGLLFDVFEHQAVEFCSRDVCHVHDLCDGSADEVVIFVDVDEPLLVWVFFNEFDDVVGDVWWCDFFAVYGDCQV